MCMDAFENKNVFLKIMKKTPNEARRSLASGQAGK